MYAAAAAEAADVKQHIRINSHPPLESSPLIIRLLKGCTTM